MCHCCRREVDSDGDSVDNNEEIRVGDVPQGLLEAAKVLPHLLRHLITNITFRINGTMLSTIHDGILF